MPVNSIPSIHISAATDAYQIPPPSHYSSDSETTMCSEGRVVATPSISQSSEAFDPYCHDGFGLDDLINSGLYGTSTKDDCIYPGIHFHSEDRGEAMDSQSNAFDGERLGSDLCYMSGPLNAHSFAAGLADIRYLAPSPSPSSSCNGSQSPASVHSELSSDNDHLSPISFTTEDSITYPTSPCLTGYHGHHPYSRPRHMSSESVATSDLTLPPRVLGHHRSHSTPSAPRPCIATQAMLHANERRRKHEAQFSCGECQQTFTAQFSLKRHQQSHTGERRFKCGIPGCTQTFFNNSDCKRHEKSKKRHPNLV